MAGWRDLNNNSTKYVHRKNRTMMRRTMDKREMHTTRIMSSVDHTSGSAVGRDVGYELVVGESEDGNGVGAGKVGASVGWPILMPISLVPPLAEAVVAAEEVVVAVEVAVAAGTPFVHPGTPRAVVDDGLSIDDCLVAKARLADDACGYLIVGEQDGNVNICEVEDLN